MKTTQLDRFRTKSLALVSLSLTLTSCATNQQVQSLQLDIDRIEKKIDKLLAEQGVVEEGPITPDSQAADIARDFADLVEVESVTQHESGSTNSRVFEIRGNDANGPLLVGVDAASGEVVKYVKQCPYPGRDGENATISAQDAVASVHEFLRANELPDVAEGFIEEKPRLITTGTMQHWRIDYRHQVGRIPVRSDFITLIVNAENGEIASYAKVAHDVEVDLDPRLDLEQAAEVAAKYLRAEQLIPAATPQMLSASLEIIYPNNYFPDLIYDFSDQQALVWVVRWGDQNAEPALDVWVDAIDGSVRGGEIYERPVPELYGIPNQVTDATVIWEPALDAIQFDTSHTFITATTETAVVNSIQNSDYFILQSHGNINFTSLDASVNSDATKLTPDEVPSNTLRYALVSSCGSGADTTGTDFWEAFINKGADVFHGYADISNPDYYELALRKYLAVGDSLWNAHWNALAASGYSKTVTIKHTSSISCFNKVRLAPLFVKTTGTITGAVVTIEAEVRNREDARKTAATDLSAKLVVPEGFSVTGSQTHTKPSLAWDKSWTAKWVVQAPATATGAQTFDVVVSSQNLGVAVDDYAKATASNPQFHSVTLTL